MLPASFQIFNFTISTFGLFLVLGAFFALYAIWSETRRDGFEELKMFDLFFLSGAIFAVFSHPFFHVGYFGGLFLAFIFIVFTCKRWKWSVFRVLDIFSLAGAFGASIVSLSFVALQRRFEFLFVFSFWLFAYALFTKLRNSKLKSGVIFSVFLAFTVLIGVLFFGNTRNLIFYFVLVTLSVVNLYFRGRKDFMAQKLSKNFLDAIKDKLTKREKTLEDTEKLLESEDPYLESGRTSDNADLEDDTNEDIFKTNVETRKNAAVAMKLQVKKALGRLHSGKYGTCEVCGNAIDKARLEAYPEATTCLECSEDLPTQE
jgi:RNA polymerase-binding transcription factor DksA